MSDEPLSAPATHALDMIVQQIEASFAAHDYAQTLRLLDGNLLEAWFGLSPETLLRMIFTIEANGQKLPAVLATIRGMMLAAASANSGELDAESSDDSQPGEQVQALADLGAGGASLEAEVDQSELTAMAKVIHDVGLTFALRLQGRPVEAMAATEASRPAGERFQTLFAAHGGWGMFSTLQGGITAMLAGDFELAETLLSEAKLYPTRPTLPFLTRDAHSKSALLHACFGDPAVAEAELAIAEQQPRTNSWVEGLLEAQAQLTRALLMTDEPAQAVEIIEAIQPSVLGEMWPYYAYAVRTVFERADQPSEAVRRLEVLDRTRLPRVDGQGFTGSVLPSLLAFSALAAGNTIRAKEQWERVDPNLTITTIGDAVFALASGDAREGARIALEARSSTRAMRQLEIWRLSVLATSLLLSEDSEGCLEVLRTALNLPRRLSAAEVGVFHTLVKEFASKHLAEWPQPSSPSGVDTFATISLDYKASPTPRELEVLEALSRGLTRDEIAKELFLSVNTVKAHQQALYRKLEVSSRNAAVIEGEQRGLI